MRKKLLKLLTFKLFVLFLTACPNEIVPKKETTKSILSFKISETGISAEIDNTSFKITATVDSDITKLTPEIKHNGVEISPASGTLQDFTVPFKYTVTAEDGSKRVYTVTIKEVVKSSSKNITAFSFYDFNSDVKIDNEKNTITDTVRYHFSMQSPRIVHTGVKIEPASGSEQDFTKPVKYTVTAEDGSTKVYTVILNKKPTYSIKYFGNGDDNGSVPVDNKEYFIEGYIEILENETLVKDGYTFACWNTKEDGSGKIYTEGLESRISEDLNLYAIWMPDSIYFYVDSTRLELTSYKIKPKGDYLIPEGVTEIINALIRDSDELTSITIPKSVVKIRSLVHDCDLLSEFIVDPENEHFSSANGVLYSKDKKVIVEVLPKTTGHFIIENGVEEIQSGAFIGVDISSVTIPNSVKIIGDYAFSGCKITSYYIPESVTFIGHEALTGWDLEEIVVDPNNQHYLILNGTLYDKNKTVLIQPPYGESGIFTVPESVLEIEKNAFRSRLYSDILLPSSLEIIKDYAFDSTCNLREINLPESMKQIRHFSFKRSAIKQIIIPINVESIGDNAFEECYDLTEVTFESTTPPTIMSLNGPLIGESSIFKGCNSLSKIYVPESAVEAYKTAPGWSTYSDLIFTKL